MFGSFPPYLQRPIHLTFAVVLAFLVNVPQKGRKKRFWTFFDIIFSVVALVVFGYFVWQNEVISEWIPFITPFFGDAEFFIAIVASLLLLEATRRVAGLPFAITTTTFLLYGRFGSYLPGVFRHGGFSWRELMEFLYFGLNGAYGIPLGVSATFIVMFIIFGCFFEKAGGGKAIINFGKCLFGQMRGGPAKIAVVTSALFGTISGSGVANVYATGTLSIPLMKKLGYKPSFAGAVEACASTGGQIMPPVMGAAAFVMADITGIPYVRIMGAALIPALLYFASVFLMVDFEAARLGISSLSQKELPTLRDILPYTYLVIPFVVLVWMLVQGFSMMRAGLFATFATIAVSWTQKGHELNLSRIIEALNLAGRRTVMIATSTAAAGIIIGVVTLTGIGLNFVGLIVDFSGDYRILGVILTAVAAIILGMGVATTVAYIIVIAVAVPALRALGFDLLPSHMFAFYFAVIALISPPVAPCSLAASAIAGSSFFRTGLTAVKVGIVSFFIPFVFIYSPELLMYGNAWEVIGITIIALSAVIALSAGVHGWFLINLNFVERSILIGGAFILICHKIITIFTSNCLIFTGLILLVFITGWLVIKRQKLTNKEEKMKKENNLIRNGISDLKLYIPGKPIEEVKRDLGLKEVVKLASNETSVGPSSLAVKAIKEEIENINLYPEGSSIILREKLAHKLKINKEMIIVANGADDVIDLIGMAFINKGDEVITGEITFPAYEITAKIMGGKIILVKLKDYTYDLEEITRRINERTKIIFICNPNNPTGTIVDKEAVDKFMKKIPDDVIVVFDEAYYDYIENKNYTSGLSYISEGKNVIILRTFSKIAGIAGVRIGYGIAKPELISYLRRVVNPFTTNRLAQVAALASLDDVEHYRKVLKTNQEGKRYLYKEIKELELFYVPTEANFIFIDLKENTEVIYEKLLKKGVIIRPGQTWGCPNFIRVTIGSPYDNKKFIEALKEAISSYGISENSL